MSYNLHHNAKDIGGQKFGRLTAIRPTEERRSGGKIVWKCECECGNKHKATSGHLRSGNVQSCGCLTRKKDISGNKYGKLKAIKETNERSGNSIVWLCRCDCGNETKVSGAHLRKGNTRSCGCLRGKHGMYGTKFYLTWNRMKQRCQNENRKGYKNYGGRGIKVCDRWQDFENFMEDMYESYEKHKKNNDYTSIDRINNNGDYTPENCRWATSSEQNRNKRNNIRITYDGKTMTLMGWSEELEIEYSVLQQRIFKLDWSITRALETPKIIKE